MKKIISRALILAAIFFASVIVFSLQLNKTETVKVVPVTGPTFPVASMEVGGRVVNEMLGGTQVISEQMEREHITPVQDDNALTLRVETNGMKIEDMTYQVSFPASMEIVENGVISDYTEEDGVIEAPFLLQTTLQKGREYTLRITIDPEDGDPIYYYTRLVSYNGTDLGSYVDWVKSFRDLCMQKDPDEELMNWVLPDQGMVNTSFNEVNIYSSTDQISWSQLQPTLVKEYPVSFVQFSSASVGLKEQYVISSVNGSDETEYYMVTDTYRVRTGTDGQIILLNFDRSAEQIFDMAITVERDEGICLGIQGKDVPVLTNAAADIAAFTVSGDLWEYNRSSNILTKIFTFRQADTDGMPDLDPRTNNEKYRISIDSVSESGDITFTVFGYMASGIHEGSTGIAVYTYTAGSNLTEEKIFLPVNMSSAVLKDSAGKLSYVNGSSLYLFLGTELIRVDLAGGGYEIVQSGLVREGFFASKSGELVAWMDRSEAPDRSSKATLMDLATGETTEITAPDGEVIEGLGFLNEDFAYGLARNENIVTNITGSSTVGLYKVLLQSFDGTINKEYERDGSYIIGSEQDTDSLILQLATLDNGVFTATGNDHITVNSKAENTVSLTPILTDRAETQINLFFTADTDNYQLTRKAAGRSDAVGGTQTILDWPQEDTLEGRYLVYNYCELIDVTQFPAEAVQMADENVGFVLNGAQQYVWERANWDESYTISANSIPAEIKATAGAWDLNSFVTNAGAHGTILNLSGCTQEELDYLINRGYPVYARTSETESAIFIGYDNYNMWVYDGSKDGATAIDADVTRQIFAANGNVFYTYISE